MKKPVVNPCVFKIESLNICLRFLFVNKPETIHIDSKTNKLK